MEATTAIRKKKSLSMSYCGKKRALAKGSCKQGRKTLANRVENKSMNALKFGGSGK